MEKSLYSAIEKEGIKQKKKPYPFKNHKKEILRVVIDRVL
jgi:hypothetical protein